MIELSLEPARIVAGVPCEVEVRARNVGPGPCTDIRVELRRNGGPAFVKGPRTFEVGHLAAGEAHPQPVELRGDEVGSHTVRVHRLEYVGPDGRLRREQGELAVETDPAPAPPTPEAPRGSVFVSYRHRDTDEAVRRLAAMLGEAFPSCVFHDRTSLYGGDLFADRIVREVAASTALLAVIGPTWLKAENDDGRRLLEDEEDFVRREIVTALDGGVDVVPVVLDGTPPPRREQLPVPLRPLCDRHFLETTSDEAGLADVVALLRRILGH